MLPADIERDECRSCGQQVLGERDASGTFRCFHCLETARAPQGEQVRLFEPVAAPMPGQTALEPASLETRRMVARADGAGYRQVPESEDQRRAGRLTLEGADGDEQTNTVTYWYAAP